MSSPFLTEPVALWEKPFIAHTDTRVLQIQLLSIPITPNSSKTLTAINGTEPSWELQIKLWAKPVDKCYTTASIIHSHRRIGLDMILFIMSS